MLSSSSPVRVSEGGERLVVVDVRGGDGRHHRGLRVAAEVLPQQPGQHGVSVRDELAFLLLLLVHHNSSLVMEFE